MSYKERPLVSIGVPCYNRPEGLKRILYSLVSQTYENIEIIISDNASDNLEVQKIGSDYAKNDARVRYFRQKEAVNVLDNFIFVKEYASGVYFMWAADDDILAIDYIEKCLDFLENDTEIVLAAGTAIYRRPDNTVYNGVNRSFDSDTPSERLLDYFRTVIDNGIFYGVYKNSVLSLVDMHRNFLGNDWCILAEIAYLGKIKIVGSTYIIRDASHLFIKNPWKRLLDMYGLPKIAERVPRRWLAMEIRFFLKKSSVISEFERDILADTVYCILQKRFINENVIIHCYDLFSRLYYPFFAR
ncbi:glycosyltransferase family 2 protein, partial [Candidatus Electronema sp. TJ]|uniref:glycosyltransferase family 2 protein n=1 Tax=Candidatus Electronema sp. TJ TaxID=3401573 RepID=UPI003AA83965